jgi:hypothetical protein
VVVPAADEVSAAPASLEGERTPERLTPLEAPGIIASMSDARDSRNPFFPLAAFCSVLFIITILALVASVFGDPRAPLARVLDQYAGRLIGGEVAAILLTGFLALFIDRRQTLRSRNDSLKAPHDQQPQG